MVRDWIDRLFHPRREEAEAVSRDLAVKRAVTRAKLRELRDLAERDRNVDAILRGFLPPPEDSQ